MLSFFSKPQGENMLVKPAKVLPARIKSINPKQKYPHIIESFAYTRKMLAFMFLFSINISISSGMYSTSKLLK